MSPSKKTSAKVAPKRKNKNSSAKEPARKVYKPVTSTTTTKEENSDVDEEELSEGVLSEIEAEVIEEVENTEIEAKEIEEVENTETEKMEIDASESAINEKPGNTQSSKEAHKAQKALKLERKLNKPHAKLISECKIVWEKLRNNKLSREDQQKLISSLMAMMKGLVVELSLKHDTSRIIQNCLKFGSQEHRDIIANELKGHYLELSKTPYGRFVINKILKYCKPLRAVIAAEFQGKVLKAIRHRYSSTVLEELFSMHANAALRVSLVQEFYGPEFSLFKSGNENMSLKQIIEKEPAKKVNILKNLQETLAQLMDKVALNHTIVHHALREYLDNADDKQIQDMITQLNELAIELLHTQDGAHIVMKLLLHASAKDRKTMVRSFKPFVLKIAKEEFGHLVLYKVFDVVDDTSLVEKCIISELVASAEELLSHKIGRRVIAYVLVGRSKAYLYPGTIKLLEDHDKIRTTTSKKDPSKRSLELRQAIAQPLLDFVTKKISTMIRAPYPAQIITELINQSEGDKAALVQAILPLISNETEEDHVLEHITANRVIKAIILFKDPKTNDRVFASDILSAIPLVDLPKRAQSWASFVIFALLETPSTEKKVRDALLPHLSELKKLVSEENANKGTKLIVDKLSA